MIHPLAVVDPRAEIGADVDIGPFTVIGPEVVIGAGTWIGPHAVIQGPTRIGSNNKVFQFASLGEVPQDLKFGGERTLLEIGDRNVFREYCTVHRGTAGGGGVTRIGNDNLFMAYVHVAHDCHIADHTVFANCASLAGHVEVGNHAVLGGFTGIHQFCRVGDHCMTGAATVAVQDIPPYVLAAGNGAQPYGINVTGLRRRGFSTEAIHMLKRAYKILYKSGLRLEEAITKIDELVPEHPELAVLARFLKVEGRGIIR
ncbi:acyl-ACP--UDP-N-acetylglucosamine O-acyltransferase [Acidiferrobacter sp.]|jgi:UDP-N-acetylglucosamine acyltransferase|uniref:acyl-ACP--UDP-N-acetylglucosamine O-acyltransferase n=1 Tax=Acidiferrobacter sp. TaxID=1872107 RepID=UPI002602B89D|nr:acyl-ACP--UDP-N-acetylglucosamine O-acyltransferase [Acidiferrobacter sp.]